MNEAVPGMKFLSYFISKSASPMSWTCPTCNKTFAKVNQSHFCVVVPIESLFENRAAHLPELFQGMIDLIEGIGDFRITTSRKAITLYAANHKAFLGVELKKKFLDIWFFSPVETDEFPVFKVLRPTKKKYALFVRLENEEDLEMFPVHLVKGSYDMIMGKEMPG